MYVCLWEWNGIIYKKRCRNVGTYASLLVFHLTFPYVYHTISFHQIVSPFAQQKRILPSLPRNKERNLKERSLKSDVAVSLAPLHIQIRAGPMFPADASFDPPAMNDSAFDICQATYCVWAWGRWFSSSDIQRLPSIGGFISLIGDKPQRKTTIDYYPTIHHPITKFETVQQLLRISEEATKKVGQRYIITTFDLGVCMKVLPMVWKYPEIYKDHIVLVGAFHTQMNFIGMLTGKKARGSGYAEILMEADLVSNGCLAGVLSGKAFTKAIFCLRTVEEALTRLLIEQFCEEYPQQIDQSSLLQLITDCSKINLSIALDDPSIRKLIQDFLSFENTVRNGSLGKTGQFWMSFIDQARLVFILMWAVKTNNRQLFHKCNGEMAPLFFAFDGQNYSR